MNIEKNDKMDKTNVNEILTKPILHNEADEDMIRSATKRAFANNWKDPEFEKAKKIFKEDENIKDKSLRAFIEWMVKNVSPETLYNTVKRKLTFKELYLIKEGETISNKKDVVEL